MGGVYKGINFFFIIYEVMAEVAIVSKMNVHVFTQKLYNRGMFGGNLIE